MKKISTKFYYKDYPVLGIYHLEFKPPKKGGLSPASFDETNGSTYVAVSHKSAVKFAQQVLGIKTKKGKTNGRRTTRNVR